MLRVDVVSSFSHYVALSAQRDNSITLNHLYYNKQFEHIRDLFVE